jgi:erythritol transport system ATP-binding protein
MTAANATSTPDDIILHASKITKIYPGTVALDAVDFNIYRGKVNVLVGENGAGKSTLMKILAGAETATKGQLLLEGEAITINSIFDAEAYGIGIIYQELNLFPNLSVSENIFMAHELTGAGGTTVNHREQEERTRKLLERLEQPIEPRTLVGDLRIGQQQIVEIAKALAQDVRILIMDEPTSALSTSEVAVLFRVIDELRTQGVSIVYISHKLDELMEIGDYVTVLRDGDLVAEAAMDTINLGWIVEKMVGRDATWNYVEPDYEQGSEILQVDDLTLTRSAGGYILDHLSFGLKAGEIIGVYGLMGAGRTELLETLMGLHPHASGDVALDGVEINHSDISQRIQAGLMLIPEDRQRDGLVQKRSVRENMLLASLRNYMSRFSLSRRKEDESVERLIKELAIKVSNPHDLITSLSGGNQQKVVVAKALLTSPKVLLMDEPTRGIDVGAKEEIFDIMRHLASQGLGIIFVSTELKEIMAMADRILVMSKGVITSTFNREDATEEKLVEASAIGHELVKVGD